MRSEWLAFGEVYPASAEAVSAYAQVMFSRRGEVLSSKRLHVSGAREFGSLPRTMARVEAVTQVFITRCSKVLK